MAKITKLKGRDPSTVEASKPKVLIYGKAGVGKSFASIEFPNVFYVDTENGADLPQYREKLKAAGASYFGVDDGALDFRSVIEQIQALATEDHDRKTLVIDSFSKLYNNQIALTQDKMERAGKEDAFGASKKEAVALTRQMISWISKLDMNVIIICHEKTLWMNGKEVGTTFDGFDKLEYELHLVLRVCKNGPERRAYVGKTRLPAFPEGENFLWGFKEFSKRYGEEVINRATVKADLCGQDQQDEYNSLLGKVKIPQDTLDKWSAAYPEVALIEKETMEKRLNWLRKQLEAQTAKS
jgi:hypothetical protein